jgi:hypothetical protein
MPEAPQAAPVNVRSRLLADFVVDPRLLILAGMALVAGTGGAAAACRQKWRG